MKIIRLKIINWRRYYGTHDIKFAVDKKQNITLFHGENDGGKTSLMCAIKWAFFATLTSDLSNPKNLVNDDAQAENINECSSTIFFSHESSDFKITRTYYQETERNKFHLWRIKDGLETPEQDGEIFIKNIFPKEICEYFFFQGEGKSHLLKHLTAKNNSIKKPVQDILGFQIAEKLQTSLRRYVSDIEKENDGYGLTEQKQRLIDKLNDIRGDVENKTKSVQEKERYLEHLEKKISDTEDELDKIKKDFPDCENIINEMDDFKEKINNTKLLIGSAEYDVHQAIYKYGWVIFSQEFVGETYDYIDDQIKKGELPGDHNVNFLTNLIDAGICICDRKINPEQAEVLEKKKVTTVTQVVQSAVQDIVAKKGLIKSKINEAPKKVKDVTSKLQDLRNNYDRYNDRLELLKLTNQELKDIGFTEKLIVVDNVKEEQLIETGKLQELKNTLKRAKDEEKEVEDKKALMQENTPTVLNNLQRISFAQDIIKYIDNYLASANYKIKGFLHNEINSFVEKFSKSKNSVKISDEYTVAFSKLGSGTGYTSIYALLITCAMIKLSQKRKDSKDPILRSSAEFPFLLDSPYGNLDENLRKVLTNLVQPVAEQLIIFVSSTQYTGKEKEVMKERIGKQYLAQMQATANKPADLEAPLKVGGKSYDRTVYEQDRDATTLVLID